MSSHHIHSSSSSFLYIFLWMFSSFFSACIRKEYEDSGVFFLSPHFKYYYSIDVSVLSLFKYIESVAREEWVSEWWCSSSSSAIRFLRFWLSRLSLNSIVRLIFWIVFEVMKWNQSYFISTINYFPPRTGYSRNVFPARKPQKYEN